METFLIRKYLPKDMFAKRETFKEEGRFDSGVSMFSLRFFDRVAFFPFI